MIKIFRTIRQNIIKEPFTQLNSKKLSRYLVYAIGEIFLVVIGILIALQINNWNQRRIDDQNEHIYLSGLMEEFHLSKIKLEELRAVNMRNYNGAIQIMEYIQNTKEKPTEASFSKILFQTFSDDIAFNPNNSLLNEMINSGNLKKLTNPNLRKQLTNWISTLDDVSKQEAELAHQRVKVLDMFRTNTTSLNVIFNQAGLYDQLGLSVPASDMSNLNLLNSEVFENNILMFMFTSYATENAHFKPLMQELEAIIKLLNEELDR